MRKRLARWLLRTELRRIEKRITAMNCEAQRQEAKGRHSYAVWFKGQERGLEWAYLLLAYDTSKDD